MIERLLVACEGALIFGGGLCLFFFLFFGVFGCLFLAGLL